MTEPSIIQLVPLLVLLGCAVITDWRARQIPNAMTLGGALFALILQATLFGPYGVFLGVTGWLVCLILFLPFYVSGGMAAGDVKLMAMVGAFTGPALGLTAVLVTLVVGAGIGLMCLLYQLTMRRFGASTESEAVSVKRGLEAKIPYAGAIAAGTSIAALGGGLIPLAT